MALRVGHDPVELAPAGIRRDLVPGDRHRPVVTVDDDRVGSRPAGEDDAADATIEGSSRDLLALLLGRPPREPLCFGGNVALAESFGDAFPGP